MGSAPTDEATKDAYSLRRKNEALVRDVAYLKTRLATVAQALEDATDAANAAAAANQLAVLTDYVNLSSPGVTGSTSTYVMPADTAIVEVLAQTLIVPAGYSYVLVSAGGSGGINVTGEATDTSRYGNVAAQAYVAVDGVATSLPGNAQGRMGGGNVSANTNGVTRLAVTEGSTVTVSLRAAKSSSGTVAGYDYVKLGATVLYTRN